MRFRVSFAYEYRKMHEFSEQISIKMATGNRGLFDVMQFEQHGDWHGSTATLKPGSMSDLALVHGAWLRSGNSTSLYVFKESPWRAASVYADSAYAG